MMTLDVKGESTQIQHSTQKHPTDIMGDFMQVFYRYCYVCDRKKLLG